MTLPDIIAAFQQTPTKLLQRELRQLGFPRETKPGGPLFLALLTALQNVFIPDKRTPTGWTVPPIVALTFEHFRQLEAELGRGLCNSGDVLFGTIQITAREPMEPMEEMDFYQSTMNILDLRDLK